MSIADFLENLESGDTVRCIKAADQACTIGPAAEREAARVAADASQPDESRYWALQIASGLRSTDRDLVAALATSALRDRYSGVRVVAISMLADLEPPHAVEAIAGLLNDDGIDPTWWTRTAVEGLGGRRSCPGVDRNDGRQRGPRESGPSMTCT